jgi:hypothetical protein
MAQRKLRWAEFQSQGKEEKDNRQKQQNPKHVSAFRASPQNSVSFENFDTSHPTLQVLAVNGKLFPEA